MKTLASLVVALSILTPAVARAEDEAPRSKVSYGALSMIASGYGAATGAFITGGVLLLEANDLDRLDAAEPECRGCSRRMGFPGEQAARASSYRELATLSFIIGGVGTGVGIMGTIWQLDLALRDDPKVGEAPTSRVAIGVAPGALSLHGAF